MILATAFLTAIVNFAKGSTRLLGASGIAFMLIALSAFVNVTSNKIPLTLVLIVLFYIVDEVIKIRKKDSVSHGAHLIGALCGILFGIYYINI